MKRSVLKLEECTIEGHANTYRTIIKTQHGRILFLLLKLDGLACTILDCFYTDRNRGKSGLDRYSCKPLKLRTFQCKISDLLSVIETELDKKFYDMEFIQTDKAGYSVDQYLQAKLEDGHWKYCFLIMVGDGESYNGLPVHLRTRLKNRLHRSIYLELGYYKEGNGVVQQCYYYDREYRQRDRRGQPPQVLSCFFPYSREGILNLVNYEICCDFTHMIVTDDLDIDSNTMPLCGAL